jgi:hypothetical protein
MQATSFSSFGAMPRRRAGLIATAVLAVAALAAGAALLDPGHEASASAPAAAEAADSARVPMGIVGDPAVSGDPSVPSAASVFKDRIVSPEEAPVSF